jgi:hypothetical protein
VELEQAVLVLKNEKITWGEEEKEAEHTGIARGEELQKK